MRYETSNRFAASKPPIALKSANPLSRAHFPLSFFGDCLTMFRLAVPLLSLMLVREAVADTKYLSVGGKYTCQGKAIPGESVVILHRRKRKAYTYLVDTAAIPNSVP